MKVTDLKENQVVHCKTHEEAKRVLELADEAGMKWQDGYAHRSYTSTRSYIEYDNWNYYQEKTCYLLSKGTFGLIHFYEKQEYEIIPSEKITDWKTEFFEERVMEVSDDGIAWHPRVVFGKKNDEYLAWSDAETVEEAEETIDINTWDYAREIDPLKEVKEAWKRGEDILFKSCFGWVDVNNPTWTIGNEYRIKPKSKYVPFTFEDAELFMNRVVIAKDKSCKAVITYSNNEGVILWDYRKSYQYLFESFTFIDGSPCGKEVEE